MKAEKFATCLNCIDGRLQLPVIEWIKENYKIDYVDMVTEPGMIEILSKSKDKSIDRIVKNIKHSLKNNKSEIIFIVGYGDLPYRLTQQKCNKDDVVDSMNKINLLFPDCKIVGLWVTETVEIELVQELVNEN